MQKIISEIKSHQKIYWLLLGIILIAGLLRLGGLSNTPFVADEFLDVNASYGYHQTGEWQAWDFNHEVVSVRKNQASDKRAWIYRWQVAQVLNHFKPTESSFRMVSGWWGILTVLILYLVTWRFTRNRWIALLASFFWAVSVPAIELNRKVRMYSMFTPIFLIFSWSWFELINLKKEKIKQTLKNINKLKLIYLLITIIFGALAYQLHPLAGNMFLITGVYLIVMIILEWKEVVVKKYIIYFLLLLTGALIIIFFRPVIW